METAESKLSAKEIVAQLSQQLPDDCTLEDFQYHLFVMQEVQFGLEDVAAGRTISHEEMGSWIENWKKR